MLEITNYIQHLIVSFGGLGVFLASIIEEIVVPIPSVLVEAGAGLFLLGDQALSFLGVLKLIMVVALPSAFGVAIGSLVIYSLAFYGGDYGLKKYGKYFFINYDKLEKTRTSLLERPRLLISMTILRFVPLFPNVVVTAACGLLKVPLKQYLISTFIGIFIRASYLGALGWLTGDITKGIKGVDTFFGKVGSLIIVLVSVSIITSVIISYLYKKKR